MTSAEFVRRIQIAVYAPTIEDTLSLLTRPPGRKPAEVLVELSKWFNQLSASDREQVRQTIQLAAHGAVFGMLCVLDGVRSIRDSDETGSLSLRYESETGSIPLNGPTGEMLHDLFISEVPPL